jgi:hypothetical protein
MEHVWDWKRFLAPYSTTMEGISEPHEFVIQNGPQNRPVMMYKLYSTSEHYYGEDWSRTVPIELFHSLPCGKPQPVIPKMFKPDSLLKVKYNLEGFIN